MFPIFELMVLMVMVAICSSVWRTGQDRGWIATIVCVSLMSYWLSTFRVTGALPSTLLELPFILLVLFCFAFVAGLHHPPLMVQSGWQWPKFGSLQERAWHAFGLSVWAVIWGNLTLLVCRVIRVVLIFLGLPSGDATRKPMEQSDKTAELDHGG